MATGVSTTYYTLLKQLGKEQRKFAFLQLVGRLEDILVKEFVFHIYDSSGGSRFALTNVGLLGERKIDIAVLSGHLDPKSKCTIKALVEARYLRNWHRAWDENAGDETATTLGSLARQIRRFDRAKHGGFDVVLSSRNREIYGLVFASFVSKQAADPSKEHFYGEILKSRAAGNFRYYDLDRPYLRDTAYDDVKVEVLGSARFCTLGAGLWRAS